MQKVLVVKPFRYSHDGVTSVPYSEGDEPELNDGAIAGLEKEGFIVIGLPAPSSAPEYEPEMMLLSDEAVAGRTSGNVAIEEKRARRPNAARHR